LGKSYTYDGQIFDTGPKRFHTDDPIVIDFIEHVLEEGITGGLGTPQCRSFFAKPKLNIPA